MDKRRDMNGTKTATGKVTIRHVATDAGVSVAAVSKVLRNAYGVSDELRHKVLQSIDKLGYRPSTAARGMRGKTFSVGMLLVEMQNPFLPFLVEGAKSALRAAGYQTLIGVGDADASMEQSVIESMTDLQMDGLILVAPRLSGRLLSRYSAQKPMAVIGHHEAGPVAFDTINSDDVAGGRMATRALLASGCRSVHMISLPRKTGDGDVFVRREQGYLQAMAEAGLSDQARIWQIMEKPGRPGDPMATVFDSGALPDGLFCWSDIHALEILNEAHLRGIAVPERLSVVGYDNTPAAAMPLVGLSSIEQQGSRLGELAAKALLSRFDGRSVSEHIQVEPRLIRRSSLRG